MLRGSEEKRRGENENEQAFWRGKAKWVSLKKRKVDNGGRRGRRGATGMKKEGSERSVCLGFSRAYYEMSSIFISLLFHFTFLP